MKRRLYRLGFFLMLYGALFAGKKIYRFFEIDSCLDSGGRWDATCECCDWGKEKPTRASSLPNTQPSTIAPTPSP